jgi:protein tyrosine/serine phosphatase
MQWIIPRLLRRLVLAGVTSLGLLLVTAGGLYIYWQAGGNFHEVEPGRYYRSAQLAPTDLDRAIRRYGIRSILNLRGKKAGSAWYDGEVATSRADGVVHLDYAILAEHPVTVTQMTEILAILRDAPQPVLVHCQAGSDRTGLVTALYLLARGKDLATAEQALSLWRYGHFPYLGNKTQAMDDSFHTFVSAMEPTPQPAR